MYCRLWCGRARKEMERAKHVKKSVGRPKSPLYCPIFKNVIKKRLCYCLEYCFVNKLLMMMMMMIVMQWESLKGHATKMLLVVFSSDICKQKTLTLTFANFELSRKCTHALVCFNELFFLQKGHWLYHKINNKKNCMNISFRSGQI